MKLSDDRRQFSIYSTKNHSLLARGQVSQRPGEKAKWRAYPWIAGVQSTTGEAASMTAGERAIREALKSLSLGEDVTEVEVIRNTTWANEGFLNVIHLYDNPQPTSTFKYVAWDVTRTLPEKQQRHTSHGKADDWETALEQARAAFDTLCKAFP